MRSNQLLHGLSIIFEGNELNFKTTIATKLHQRLQAEIVKGSSFEIGSLPYEEMVDYFRKIAHKENIIIDRFLYSNIVYATLYKGFTLINQEDRKEIESIIKEKSVLVYLHAPTEILQERFDIRGDKDVEAHRLEEINDTYEPLVKDAVHQGIKTLIFDTSVFSSDVIVDRLIAYIKAITE